MKRAVSRVIVVRRVARQQHPPSLATGLLATTTHSLPHTSIGQRYRFDGSSRPSDHHHLDFGEKYHTKHEGFHSTRSSTSSSTTLINQAHRLLDGHGDALPPEQWMEAEDCVWSLSNARTAESVDLTLLLLDKLLLARQKLLLHDQDDDTSLNKAYTEFLTNWELWHSVLINWQQVSKEQLSGSNNVDDSRMTSPSKLLAMLDSWNALLASTPSVQQFNCTTSKTLSLLIDVVGRRGQRLADQPNCSAKEVLESAELAETLLFRMIDQSESNVNSFPPSTSNLNMVLWLWAAAARVDRAWLLLKRTSEMVPPDLRSYNAVLQAYAATGNGAAAEQVLHELCRTDTPVKPDVTTWNIVLAAWARSPDKVTAAERVEQLLVSMMMYGGNGTKKSDETFGPLRRQSAAVASLAVKPDLTTFNTALSAWARVGEADTCARLLGEMRDLYKAGRLEDPPDVFSYSTVMNAFAKAGQPDKAEALSDEMYTAFKQHGMVELKPTIPILTSILDAYSRKIGEAATKKDNDTALNSIQRAQRVFQRMRELNQFGFLETGPDTTAYNVMLTCYLRSSYADTFPRVNTAAEQADILLQEMKQMYRGAKQSDAMVAPTFKSYSIVIQAWLQRPDGIHRAVQLLDELWKAQTTGGQRMSPDSLSLHCIIVGFCRANRPDVAQKLLISVCETKRRDPSSMIEPRLASFGSVVGSLSRSRHPNSARIAQSLVNQMEELFKMGVLSEGPDHLIYQTLVSLWAYSDRAGSAKKAYSILSEMRRRASSGETSMQPDLITYNQVIYALSRGDPQPVYAERVLRQMYEDYKNGVNSVKPNNKSFNTALSAWARFNHPISIDRADALFQEMQNLHKAGELVCDAVTYNIMLNCLATTSRRDGAQRAETIVEKMKELSEAGDETFRPNAVSYGCLIKAWVRVGDAARAQAVLSKMFEDYTRGEIHMKPQLRHFEQVGHAWSASTDASSNEKIQSVLEMKQLLYPDAKGHASAPSISNC
jgi:pentatricopeptide repeat protein